MASGMHGSLNIQAMYNGIAVSIGVVYNLKCKVFKKATIIL